MARFQSDDELRVLGEALAALRRERGLSQAEAGLRLGMTSQGWGLYEAGKRPGLFRPDVQRRLTTALDATPEDLALLVAGPPASDGGPTDGLEARGRAYRDESAALRRLQLSSDELAPWAASGVVLEYAPGRWPRQGQGCIIETTEGELLVRLYEGGDGETLRVRGGGGLDREERLAHAGVRAVSAVVARRDW